MNFDITDKVISAFTMYKFLEEISKPFTQLKAYRDGLIDEEGYFKLPPEMLKGQIPSFDLFVIYIKRLFNQIPNPQTKAKLNQFTSAMELFKECLDEYGLDGKFISEGITKGMVDLELIEQESTSVPANNAGSGEIAGFGNPLVDPEDGYDNLAIKPRKKCKDKNSPLCNVVDFMNSIQRRKPT